MKILVFFLVMVISVSAEPTVKQLFSVQKVGVKKEFASHTLKVYGYVQVDEKNIYEVTPRFGGYVEKLFVDTLYTKVKKGEPLATVYSPEVYKAKEDYLNSYYYAKKSAAKGMVESARKKLSLLGVSEKEITAVIKGKKVEPYTTIYAPKSGYVFGKNIFLGGAFHPKKMLYKIVDLDDVWVEAKLFDKDIQTLKSIENFRVVDPNSGMKFQAKKSLLYPKLDPKKAAYTLRLSLKNRADTLAVGAYVNVVGESKKEEYLTLPKTAVIRKNGKFYSFLVTEFEGEYEPKEIKVKALNHDRYRVVDGLDVGDEVVNNALFMIDSDTQINNLY
ncbi:efflux RND transporter periplasmic adaptor subunit [Sulfurimonas microaerophilic]|uniref:efflux RND transporter periplasmic adaptor subunit n=1 Tax=Sulfurimonas microaerophilic TaxID=3058392 RepID=UPI00271522A0|nr:efflux RND transporter periplasmic adaptor subunit [Sulfurimonas sp. hsl 1-7]